MQKTSMSDEDRMKYLEGALLAGVTAAGTGALIRSMMSKKRRAKIKDVANSKNAIVVPILKSKFMEDVKTPEQVSADRGDAGPGTRMSDNMSESDLASAKKNILRGRSVDFFGRKSAEAGDDDGSPEDNGGEIPKREKRDGPEGKRSEGVEANRPKVTAEDSDGRTLLRDQTGKFVSPTDPVAVAQAEKSAGVGDWLGGLWNVAVHPIESGKVILNAAADKPVMFTAGTLGSIYLAAKISDMISKRRRKKSEERLNDMRDKYVALMEGGNEKAAGVDPRVAAGTVLGGAFFVPMALSAIITNKIIENRKEDKKRSSELADSYPADPIILYRTIDGNDIETTPEAMLSTMAVKRAMYISAESGAFEEEMSKEAQLLLGSAAIPVVRWGMRNVVKPTAVSLAGKVGRMGKDELYHHVDNMLTDRGNDPYVLDMVKAMHSNDNAAIQAAFSKMVEKYPGLPNTQKLRIAGTLKDPKRVDKLKNHIATSRAFQDSLVKRFSDNHGGFADFRKQMLDDRVAGWGFNKGGFLHKMITWFMSTFGLDRSGATKAVNQQFEQKRQQLAQAKAQARANKPTAEKLLSEGIFGDAKRWLEQQEANRAAQASTPTPAPRTPAPQPQQQTQSPA